MKRVFASVCLVLFFVTSGSAHARGQVVSTIKKITASNSVLLIFFDSPIISVSGETIPVCSTRTDHFTMAASQKSQLAIALTAMALGSSVSATGTDGCTNKGNVEDLSFITVITE